MPCLLCYVQGLIPPNSGECTLLSCIFSRHFLSALSLTFITQISAQCLQTLFLMWSWSRSASQYRRKALGLAGLGVSS